MDRPRSDPGASSALGKLAGFVIAVVVLAGIYVGYQALQVLFPPNTYETALLATVADTVDADGVLLFDEVYVPGGGTLGYLAADGERVSAGAAVAEIYSSPEQAGLRQQLTSLNDQIELLQRSQNTTATQLDSLKKERASALYDMMDALDSSDYDETAQGEENYILAQNKLWVITGEVSDFSAQIASLTEQSAQVQAQLGGPTQITAPQTGYFIRSSASERLNAGADDILALNTTDLQAYLNSDPELPLDGCAGKIVSGFAWRYVGLCSAKEGEKLLGDNGKPLTRSVKIKFPRPDGDAPQGLRLRRVTIDEATGLARFVITCEIINGDVLRLNRASAQITRGRDHRPARPHRSANPLSSEKEDAPNPETQGENYIPGVYVKYAILPVFCKIDPRG